MGFQIKPIDSCIPEEGKVYLFDANVWRFILAPPMALTKVETNYIDFFDAVINLASNPKCKSKPTIYLNALILSEVYNSYVRSHWDVYESKYGKCSFKEFRKTQDYTACHNVFISDFVPFLPNLRIETDLGRDPVGILKSMKPGAPDFNDQCYFDIAVEKGFSIVTNDGDFVFEGVEILTQNYSLLKHK
jgi:predicted nucleic acid-binding protein